MTNPEERIDSRPLIMRNLVWDMFPHTSQTRDVVGCLGLVQSSPECFDMEHVAAHNRMVPLLQINQPLSGIAKLAIDVLTGVMLGPLDSDTEYVPLTREVIEQIVRASTVGIMAYLLDEQVVQVNDGLSC